MKVLTYPEAGERLGISEDSVRRLVRQGLLRVVDVGTGERPRFRVREDDLRLFIDNRTAERPTGSEDVLEARHP